MERVGLCLRHGHVFNGRQRSLPDLRSGLSFVIGAGLPALPQESLNF